MSEATDGGRSRRDAGLVWLAVAVIIVLALATWFCVQSRKPSTTPFVDPEGPQRVRVDDVEVSSPELLVGPATIRGAVYPEFVSWLVITSCAEEDGCEGVFAAVFDVRHETGRSVVRLDHRFDVPAGGELRFEGLLDGRFANLAVDECRIEVISRGTPAVDPDTVVEL